MSTELLKCDYRLTTTWVTPSYERWDDVVANLHDGCPVARSVRARRNCRSRRIGYGR